MANEINKAVDAAIRKWSKNAENAAKAILSLRGKGGSRLFSDIKTKFSGKDGEVAVEFEMPGYAEFVDSGRKPGKMPPIKSIEEWCRRKGKPASAAFPISRAIGERGLKPVYFTKPLRDVGSLTGEIAAPLNDAVSAEIMSAVPEELKKTK